MKPTRSKMAVAALVGGVTLACASQASDAPPVHVPVGQPRAADKAFVDWARAHAVPLRTLDGKRDAIDPGALKRVVGKARVVALGEPAHGAHEPLAFRNQIFQSLVEHSGFTAIALESGFSEARRVNDFVMGGPGDAQEIARTGLTWGFGTYSENVELLRWLRQYNDDPVHTSKVKFYGIDVSGGDTNGRLSTARIALEDVLTYLSRVAPESSRRARNGVAPYIEKFTHEGYVALSPNERAKLDAAVDDLISILESDRQNIVAASSAADYAWAHRNALVARQIAQMFRAWPAETPGDAPTPGLYKAVEARDASMADNVQWILDQEGPSGRVLVFAHNAHVMNAPVRGGMWDVYPTPPRAMGQYLRAAFGADMLIVGVSSAANGNGVAVEDQNAGSLDIALMRTRLARFALDLRDARHIPAVSAFLSQPQSMRANYTTALSLTPQEAFDVLVSIDQLTPAGSVRLRAD